MLNFHVCSQSNLQLFFCEEHFDQKRTTNLHSKQILSSPGVTWVRWTVTTTMLAKRANLNQRQRSRGSNINFIIVPPKHRICLWNVLVFHLLLFSNAVCVLEPGHHLTGCVRPVTSGDIHALVSLLLTGVQRVVVLRDSGGAGPR